MSADCPVTTLQPLTADTITQTQKANSGHSLTLPRRSPFPSFPLKPGGLFVSKTVPTNAWHGKARKMQFGEVLQLVAMQPCKNVHYDYFQPMNATLTDLRNPGALLKAADAGETIVIERHGRPAYELKAVPAPVDWEAMERNKADWFTPAEVKEVKAAIEASAKVFTHDRFP